MAQGWAHVPRRPSGEVRSRVRVRLYGSRPVPPVTRVTTCTERRIRTALRGAPDGTDLPPSHSDAPGGGCDRDPSHTASRSRPPPRLASHRAAERRPVPDSDPRSRREPSGVVTRRPLPVPERSRHHLCSPKGIRSMSKRKFARLAAVMTTLVATVALISTVVASSGAYFTDSHAGQPSPRPNGTRRPQRDDGSSGDRGRPDQLRQPAARRVPRPPTIDRPEHRHRQPKTSTSSSTTANDGWSAVNDARRIRRVHHRRHHLRQPEQPRTRQLGAIIPDTVLHWLATAVPRRPAPIDFLPHYIKVAYARRADRCKQFDDLVPVQPLHDEPPAIRCSARRQSAFATPLNFSVVGRSRPASTPTSQFNGASKIALTLDPAHSPSVVQYCQ